MPNSFSTLPGLWLASWQVSGSRQKKVAVVLLVTRNWAGTSGCTEMLENTFPAFIGTQHTGLSGYRLIQLMLNTWRDYIWRHKRD